MSASAILQFGIFAAVAVAAFFGLRRLMRRNGDIKDLPKL